MVVRLPWPAIVVLDAVAWILVSALAGWRVARWTAAHGRAADHDGPVLRLRRFEHDGRWYQRCLRVKSWKHWLPEAGRAFGGRSKRRLPARGDGGTAAFLSECRRAERTHWLILAATPLFVVWNPPGLFAAMAVYAVAANVPCLLVLRYNRARLLRRPSGQARAA